jgi:hypothetical protein
MANGGKPTKEQEQLLDKQFQFCRWARDTCVTRAAGSNRLSNLLGIITILVTALLGGSVGTTLVKGIGVLAETEWRRIGTVLGVTVAVVAGIQNQFKLPERTERYRVAAANYADLARRIKQFRALPRHLPEGWAASEGYSPPIADALELFLEDLNR